MCEVCCALGKLDAEGRVSIDTNVATPLKMLHRWNWCTLQSHNLHH